MGGAGWAGMTGKGEDSRSLGQKDTALGWQGFWAQKVLKNITEDWIFHATSPLRPEHSLNVHFLLFYLPFYNWSLRVWIIYIYGLLRRHLGQVAHDGRGFGCSVGESEECLQAEWSPHPLSAGCGHWLSFGLLPEDTASLRAGQSVSSPETKHDVTQNRWHTTPLKPTQHHDNVFACFLLHWYYRLEFQGFRSSLNLLPSQQLACCVSTDMAQDGG